MKYELMAVRIFYGMAKKGVKEEVKVARKRGRPRKEQPKPLPVEQELSYEEESTLRPMLSRLVKLRRISTLTQLYEQMPRIRAFVEESYRFGDLSLLPRLPPLACLHQMLLRILR